MAYCVHCGVELAPSEKACPLCLTHVFDPSEVERDVKRPYPDRLETVNAHVDRRYGAKLATLFLMIPLAAVLICDLAISLRITWSAYVLGAGACICCWTILPFYLNVRRPYLYIAVDVLSASAYLALIAWRIGGMDWYFALALPLALLAGLSALICVYIARRSRMPVLYRFSNMVLVCAAALVGLEALITLHARGAASLRWSIIALISLAAFSAIFRVIEKNPTLKANIARRLYL